MFGISWAEFFVILLVAVIVIPVRYWPDVARFLARAVKMVRGVIWKITDASEQLRDQIDMEQPINDLINTARQDVMETIRSSHKQAQPSKRKPKARVKK
ncbi:twin-arginine translocase TatA/TatE family subunit [bacterium]|nr:twin-arginine translocase TatA/TatE family subunit [bacterium]